MVFETGNASVITRISPALEKLWKSCFRRPRPNIPIHFLCGKQRSKMSSPHNIYASLSRKSHSERAIFILFCDLSSYSGSWFNYLESNFTRLVRKTLNFLLRLSYNLMLSFIIWEICVVIPILFLKKIMWVLSTIKVGWKLYSVWTEPMLFLPVPVSPFTWQNSHPVNNAAQIADAAINKDCSLATLPRRAAPSQTFIV